MSIRTRVLAIDAGDTIKLGGGQANSVIDRGKKAREAPEVYQLSESLAFHSSRFGAKNANIESENTYYWTIHN